ncbi:hypothetical protein PINS_up005589 [Pythium insidiosum]|nr:hypothetical protein PINS_up005589 [Pythium insidiosum]
MSSGETPLHCVVASGDTSLLRILLDHPSIDVDKRGVLGATALLVASNAGDPESLRLLLAAGADPTARDDNAWTAMHYATASSSGLDALRFLCEIAPELIDCQCHFGNTALHIGAAYGHDDMVRTLLETAANPHLVNREGHSAYQVALHHHHIRCAVLIHGYQETSSDAYLPTTGATKTPTARKEDQTLPPQLATGSALTGYDEYLGVPVSPEASWITCSTSDGLTYFYNSITGESTWHNPYNSLYGVEETRELEMEMELRPPPAPLVDASYKHTSNDATVLPLCMIPIASPLVILDDPSAPVKLESRRKREREKRRLRIQSQRSNERKKQPPAIA